MSIALAPRPRTARRPRLPALLAFFVTLGGPGIAFAQLTSSDLSALREQGEREGWTFTVGENGATVYSLNALCGTRPPSGGDIAAPMEPPRIMGDLPAAFDWRDVNGCTPVKAQGECGACWAFATVGALESAILIKDGITVDLSEQWLISCNTFGYGCDGGWFAHDHHVNRADHCGGSGAVLESDFPYVHASPPCGCPYPHAYKITHWAYVGNQTSVPTIAALKQAIYTYGPVSASVYADETFQAYTSGIYNHCGKADVNHGVVVVGWDDQQGVGGVWIVRNSWGPSWGESGYMRMPYDCANIGLGACYIEYAGTQAANVEITPSTVDLGQVEVGQVGQATLTVKNLGPNSLIGSVLGLDDPFSIEGNANYSLSAGAFTTFTLRFEPRLRGTFARSLRLSSGGPTVPVTGSGTGDGIPAEQCTDAASIGDGLYHGSNVGASSETTASCVNSDAADVWWAFSPPFAGTTTIDTVGSDFDTVLSVYDGCAGTEIACNDDSTQGSAGTRISRVALDVQSASQYWIRVAGVDGTTGNIVLGISTRLPPLAISGYVTDEAGQGIGGVTLAGLPGGVVTSTNGYYTALVEHGFSGTVSAIKGGWTFDPPQRVYTSLTADQTEVDFTGRAATFKITGRITDVLGAALAGVTLTGLPGQAVTDATGAYSAEVAYGFNGDVTPQLSGYTFSPPRRSYRGLGIDRLEDDYVGTPPAGAVQIMLQPIEAAGARWRVDGGTWCGSGQTASNLGVGSHQVEYEALSGWIAPPAETVTIAASATSKLTRNYTRVRYGLLAGVTPADAGTLTADPAPGADGMYDAGTVVTLTAVPNAGYHLLGWIGADDGVRSDDGSIRFTIDADRTVRAEFEQSAVAGRQLTSPLESFGIPMCGGGTMALLPLMLVGLCGLRRRGRKQSF